MKPLISIIVPIFNMERYIARCLASLLQQTHEAIEVIAVNDGSTDRSALLLDAYSIRDARVRVIHQHNAGVSAARNRGLAAAKGEWIGFVDPDDWVDVTMFERLLEAAESHDADVAMCTYMREFGTHSKARRFSGEAVQLFEKEAINRTLRRRLIGPLEQEMKDPSALDAWGTIWTKLYRHSLMEEYEIYFHDLAEIGTSEDTLFNVEILGYADRLVFLNEPLYHYWRGNEASVTAGFKPQLLDQWFTLYRYFEKSFPADYTTDYAKALANRTCLNTLGLGLNTISKTNTMSVMEKVKHLRGLLKDERLRESFREFDASVLPAPWRVFYTLAKRQAAASTYMMLVMIEQLRKTVR